MPWTSKHIKWFVDTKKRLQTADGKAVKVWEFRHQNDDKILSAWAKHFRNHYCLDTEIDFLRKGCNYSRKDYLNNIKFPDPSVTPGPSIRAGDFGEILVADYLQYLLGYWVPRTKYCDKTIRNESTKGCDIIGFKFLNDEDDSPEDTLAIFEAKTQFTGSKPVPKLQEAIDGSSKDYERKAESLNAIKQRLFKKKSLNDCIKIERFQNPEDRPYKENYGAVAIFTTKLFDAQKVSRTITNNHPEKSNLSLVVIHGDDMMNLVHELYRRAADEA
jgi:hypothetical protein